MSDDDAELVFETVLDAPPEKIWRALTIPEFRDRWLQPPDGVSVQLVSVSVNSLLTYSWNEGEEESLVTIELTPHDNGSTGFRLTHAPVTIPTAANSNEVVPIMLRAA